MKRSTYLEKSGSNAFEFHLHLSHLSMLSAVGIHRYELSINMVTLNVLCSISRELGDIV